MKDELWLKATDSIASTMDIIGEPLSSAQRTVLSGAIAVWLEKAADMQKEKDAKLCEALRGNRWVSIEAGNECADAIRSPECDID